MNAISWFCIVFHLWKIIRLSNSRKMLLYFIILPSAVKHGHLATIIYREVVLRLCSFRVSLYSISNESIRGVHKQPLEPITLTYVPTTLLRLKWSIKLCFFVPLSSISSRCVYSHYLWPHPTPSPLFLRWIVTNKLFTLVEFFKCASSMLMPISKVNMRNCTFYITNNNVYDLCLGESPL